MDGCVVGIPLTLLYKEGSIRLLGMRFRITGFSSILES